MRSITDNRIIARSIQLSEDAQNRRIFWLIETVGTESSSDYGMNFFALYSLTFAQSDQDSAVDLSFSVLRQRTSLIANITAKDSELSYESLQMAVDNLAKMYNDTLDLSTRAGNPDPCVLPLSADIADFKNHDTENSLSSFQSSLADSLQSSLICSPVNLHVTPLAESTIPIIPRPLSQPKSSTPTVVRCREEDNEENTRIRQQMENCDWVQAMKNLLCDSTDASTDDEESPALPVPSVSTSSELTSNTVIMRTVGTFPSSSASFPAWGLLQVPTLDLMDGLTETMDYSPQVTPEDLSFVAAAEAGLHNTLVNNQSSVSNDHAATTINNDEDYHDQVPIVSEHTTSTDVPHTSDTEHHHVSSCNVSKDGFIPYQTLEELYSNVDYVDTDASDDEYY